MNRKAGLYAVIGGGISTVLTMAVCSVLPLGAQSQSDGVFGEITCTGLTVVDAEGRIRVTLHGESVGAINVYGEESEMTIIGAGNVTVWDAQ